MEWFAKIGWVYMPINIMGWLITAFTFLICSWVFYLIDIHSHSVSDIFSNVFPYAVSFFTVRHWIASNTCADTKK
ncbi:hypothetical protein BH10BAC1_BH10BAC1_09570 [soil metagenome]